MKIFGNTRIQGRIAADTGSFKTYGILGGEVTPNVFVAGTDSPGGLTLSGNRSVVVHGQYDYIVTSQDSGISFGQAKLTPGNVMGYRVQHVSSDLIYALRTNTSNSANSIDISSIAVSKDGGLTFKSRYNPNIPNSRPNDNDPDAYRLPMNIVAFDMFWTSKDEGFVVGAKLTHQEGGTGIAWQKFTNYGLGVTSGNTVAATPVILKKQAGATEFVEWGTPPTNPVGKAVDAITAIAVDPLNSNIIIVGTQLGKLYRSTNGALTWEEVGAIGASNTCVNRIKFVTGNSSIVYAVGHNASIVRSNSGGTDSSWYKVSIDPLVARRRDGRTPAFNDILLPNTSDVFIVGEDHTQILRSRDAGVSWEFIPSGIYSDYHPIEYVKSITIDLVNYYVAVSKNKLFVTANPDLSGADSISGQIDWYEVNIPDEIVDLQLVTTNSPDPNDEQGYVHILTKTGLYEYWINGYKLSSKRDFSSITTATPVKLHSNSYREIYITTNDSKIIRGTKYNYSFSNNFTFVEETNPLTNENLMALNSAKTGRIFAGSTTGKIIYKDTGSIVNETTYSTDPVTWSQTTTTPTASTSNVLQIQALDNLNVFALLEDTGSYQVTLFKSVDSGSNWTQLYVYQDAIRSFVAYNTASIYAMTQDGAKFIYTTSSFAEITTTVNAVNQSSSYASVFDIDAARSNTENDILFLLGGSFGVRATTLNLNYPIMGPWNENTWTLTSIAGQTGKSYWIGGGTTFPAVRSTATSLGSEPILLVSEDGGDNWSNAISRLSEQEPPSINNSGGDFTFTSISEGEYFVEGANDVFNIYSSNNKGTSFDRYNSNLYLEDKKYPGNLDGIRKIRFYDSQFGVAVGDIENTEPSSPPANSKIAITTDGGNTWKVSEGAAEEYHYNSVFVTTQSAATGQYEIYVTAYPANNNDYEPSDGVIFKSVDSGRRFTTNYSLGSSGTTDGLTLQPLDIFFVNNLTGSFTVRGNINGAPPVEGIYRTGDGGLSWNFVTITDFAASDTRGHLQFITTRKGYVAGAYGSNKNSGLFKTTDSGLTWTRLSTNYDSTANKPITAMHFLTEAVGVIGVGSEIWRTTDSGSNWTKVHDLKLNGKINEIKFSSNGTYGLAVGHYDSDVNVAGEHFVLKSLNSGSTWQEADENHSDINLEFKIDASRRLVGQPSTLYTVAFAERVILSEQSQSIGCDNPPCDPERAKDTGCITAPFMSASWYNYENFAYKCNPTESGTFRYYPNSSNNIGLGRGIFGQRTSVPLRTLKNRVAYGAALGVGSLGKAEYSQGDTATGFGAMDQVKRANNNVAIGYKALSYSILDNQTTPTNKTATNTFITSSIFGVTTYGKLVVSSNGGETWEQQVLSPSTNSFTTSSITGSMVGSKVYTVGLNEVILLLNDESGSGNIKTAINKYNVKSGEYKNLFTSSLYRINELEILNSSTVFGIDTGSGVFFKSINGARTFKTGSISNISGNSVKSFRMFSQTLGCIVGTEIWIFQSGSQTSWETSSYTGSHTLNAVDYVNATTWIAVGTSGSVYRSTNKGQNWNYISTGISGSTLTTNNLIDVQTVGSKIIAVGNSGPILFSNDNGITWKTGSFSVTGSTYEGFSEITILDSNASIIKHSDGILKSTDGGNTWAPSQVSINSFDDSDTAVMSFASSKYSAIGNLESSIDKNVSIDKILLEEPAPQAQQPADKTDENVAVGSYALYSFENASKMVAIGSNAFRNMTTNKGKQYPNLNYEDFYRPLEAMPDLIIGSASIKVAPNFGQVGVGAYAQYTSENSSYNTSVGYATMYDSQNANYNTALGFYSQHLGQNNRNTAVGAWALGWNGNLSKFIPNYSASMRGGDDNVAIGYKALFNNLDSIRARQIIRDAGGVNRVINHIDEGAWLTIPYAHFGILGSRNISIGNYSFLNASGSADTIVMGYRAVSERGYDITDSVFIGSYVGENFGTKIGTYYSSSTDNDWKFTQTVAVGTRALQNQIGYDIVAIGANALRGTQTGGNAATPDVTISTDAFGVLAVGFFNSKIVTRTDFSDFEKRIWSVSEFVKKTKNDYGLYDEIGGIWKTDSTGGTLTSIPWAISIASRETAYAVVSQKIDNLVYPLIVRTDELSKTKSNNSINWNVVQPGPIKNFGPVIGKDGLSNLSPYKLNVPDTNTIYLLVKQLPNTQVKSASKILKATSSNEFSRPHTNPITYNQVNLPDTIHIQDMHFPSAENGIAIGYNKLTETRAKTAYITTDGGITWSSSSVDSTASGSSVELSSVWMSNDGAYAYAAGNYGSIYRYQTGSWAKSLGASSATSIGGTFWDTVLFKNQSNESISAVVFFANRVDSSQNVLRFFDIKFLSENPSIGYAIGMSPTSWTDAAQYSGWTGTQIIIAKTTDGGATWQHQPATLPDYCTSGRISTIGEGTPFIIGNTTLTVIDADKVFFGMNYGTFGYTTNGGTTWKFSDSVFGSATRTSNACGCNPWPYIPCTDYKKFDSSSITVSGNSFEDIIQTVTVGSEAQAKMPAVNNNVAIGYKVQFNGTGSASGSVQIGAYATIQANNSLDTVAIGMDSLESIQHTRKNTAVGRSTLDNLIQPTSALRQYPAPNPVCAGGEPKNSTDGAINTVIGFQAGTTLIAGDKNVFVGANSGMQLNAPAVRTWGYNNIIIGTNAAKTQYNIANQVAIGNQDIDSYVAWGVPNINGWAWQSDARDKTDTGSFTVGLEFIRQIQPKQFKWDGRFNYATGSPDGTYKHSGSSYGYIAQDLENAATTLGISSSLFILNASGSYSGSTSDTGSFDIKLVKPAMVNLIAINAIKDLDATVTYLSSSKYTTNLGDGANTSYPVTHSLGTRDVIAMVYGNSSNLVVYPTMSINSTNTMTITFNQVPSTNEYRLVVMR